MPPYLSTDYKHSERGSFRFRKAFLAGLVPAVSFGLLGLSGCGKDEPEYYETETVQSQPAAQPVPPAMTATQPAASSGPGFTFAMPEGWSQQEASSMVIMSMKAGVPPEQMADVQVSAFPGDVGGQLANLDRWRRQVGLGPVDPAAAAGFITAAEVSGIESWQVDLTGPEGMGPDGTSVRMIVTAVPYNGQTWFFKMVGAAGAVEGQMANYEAFLQTVTF